MMNLSEFAAIKDIPKGARVPLTRGKVPPVFKRIASAGGQVYDYSELLPDDVAAEYGLWVSYRPWAVSRGAIRAEIYRRAELNEEWPNRRGFLEATFIGEDSVVEVNHSNLDEELRGKGIGKILYEAVYKDAHRRGARYVMGGEHSTLAHRTHLALNRKHGWKYDPDPNRQSDGGYMNDADWENLPTNPAELEYDGRWRSYQFRLNGVPPSLGAGVIPFPQDYDPAVSDPYSREYMIAHLRDLSQGAWFPASGGTEEPFYTRSGRRLLYVYQPSTGRHAYLDLSTDLILSDEEAAMLIGT